MPWFGRPLGIVYGNGTTRTYAYDAIGRLSGLQLDLAGTGSDQVIGKVGGTGTAIGYNPAMQIVSAARSNDAYAWTGHYNVDRPYTPNGLNQYAASGATNLGYDARGNLTSAVDTSATPNTATGYGYDKLNMLTSVSGAATLYYNPLGQLQEYDTSVSTRMFYSGEDLVAEVANPSGTVLRRYVPGPWADAPVVWYEGSGTADRRFLQGDERGSVIAVSDSSGNALAINRYDEYGIAQTSNPAYRSRFLYTGQAFYPEIGLYDYKARMYSATLGRFMQTDPIGYADGMNWYAYAHGDPVNFTDPSGLEDNEIVVTANRPRNDFLYLPRFMFDTSSFSPHLPDFDKEIGSEDHDDTVDCKKNPKDARCRTQSGKTKTCSGRARGLQGNSQLYGRQGAFSGVTVQPHTAAIIPSQFGVTRAQLQPYIGRISGGLSNGRTTTYFSGITDVIGGASPIPGASVRDALQQLNPGQFIVEIPGGQDVGSNATVVLMGYPADLPCPTGTSAE